MTDAPSAVLPWLPELRAALDAEYASRPYVVALATVDENGRPRVRSVVCRRAQPDGTLWVCSDARSGKNTQLRRNPHTELVFWLPGRREQFRVAGWVEIVSAETDDPRRGELWGELSDAARALFAWPEPGAPRHPDPAAFPEAIDAGGPIPDTFDLLVIAPEEVEHLDLKVHPHRRRRWRRRTVGGRRWLIHETHLCEFFPIYVLKISG